VRKRIVHAAQDEAQRSEEQWLDLDAVADVEVTSEEVDHPVEGALLPGRRPGWRASGPGEQTIRLLFPSPQRVSRIRVEFEEPDVERTQEFVLRWTPHGEASPREVVRQRWNFSPRGSTTESEDYPVDLTDVSALELAIVPDVSGGEARASLTALRLA
jgi:hypothetical protein